LDLHVQERNQSVQLTVEMDLKEELRLVMIRTLRLMMAVQISVRKNSTGLVLVKVSIPVTLSLEIIKQ